MAISTNFPASLLNSAQSYPSLGGGPGSGQGQNAGSGQGNGVGSTGPNTDTEQVYLSLHITVENVTNST